MGALPELPAQETIDPTGDYSRAQSWALVKAKWADAGNWAHWAATALDTNITKITTLLGSDTVEADLQAIMDELGTITNSTPGTIDGAGAGFSDALLTALKNRLTTDLPAYSTGLGSTVETAMFDRETARVGAARTAAYNEVTNSFSSRGFDLPPGALLAKQTELSSADYVRLADASGKILEESARLAQDYNKHVLTVTTQLLEALARSYESEEARKFEASKATVMLAVENYKSYLGLYGTKAELALKKGQLVLDNKARQLALEVETFRGLANNFQQMVASALNGVNMGASFNWSGSAGTTYSRSDKTTA